MQGRGQPPLRRPVGRFYEIHLSGLHSGVIFSGGGSAFFVRHHSRYEKYRHQIRDESDVVDSWLGYFIHQRALAIFHRACAGYDLSQSME